MPGFMTAGERILIWGQRPVLTTGVFCVKKFLLSIRKIEKASDIDLRRQNLASFRKVFYVC